MKQLNAQFKTALLTLLYFAPRVALATTTGAGGGSLPWENGLNLIQTSLTGPVALAISAIGIVSAGAVLVFGGDVPEFGRRLCYLVMVIGLLVSSVSILNTLFATGAVI